jgi:predicted small integral membrane protein
MAVRLLKVIFVVCVSLLCLFYAAQNVANLEACYQAFAYVLGSVDHQVYPDSIFPVIQSPVVTWLALGLCRRPVCRQRCLGPVGSQESTGSGLQ